MLHWLAIYEMHQTRRKTLQVGLMKALEFTWFISKQWIRRSLCRIHKYKQVRKEINMSLIKFNLSDIISFYVVYRHIVNLNYCTLSC